MKHTTPVTPTEYKRVARSVRVTLAAYRAARVVALAAIRAHKASKTGRTMLAQEEALGAAYWARHEWLGACRRMAEYEARGVQRYAHISPAAAERALKRKGNA